MADSLLQAAPDSLKRLRRPDGRSSPDFGCGTNTERNGREVQLGLWFSGRSLLDSYERLTQWTEELASQNQQVGRELTSLERVPLRLQRCSQGRPVSLVPPVARPRTVSSARLRLAPLPGRPGCSPIPRPTSCALLIRPRASATSQVTCVSRGVGREGRCSVCAKWM